jgi:hypothetical protein
VLEDPDCAIPQYAQTDLGPATTYSLRPGKAIAVGGAVLEDEEQDAIDAGLVDGGCGAMEVAIAGGPTAFVRWDRTVGAVRSETVDGLGHLDAGDGQLSVSTGEPWAFSIAVTVFGPIDDPRLVVGRALEAL